jgi:hypothetical protein
MWQNQYNLTHLMVPKLQHMLLPDLQNIKQVIVEKFNEKLKRKGKATTSRPDAKSNPKRKASRFLSDQVPKKACSKKFCNNCKAHGSPYLTHNTSDCHCYDKDSKPLDSAAGKSTNAKKPFKKFGGHK